MSSPFATYPAPGRSFMPASSPSASSQAGTKTTGAKRGRKPKTAASSAAASPVVPQGSLPPSQPTQLQWTTAQTTAAAPVAASSPAANPGTPVHESQSAAGDATTVLSLPGIALPGTPGAIGEAGPSSNRPSVPPAGGAQGEDDNEGEDDILPAMADDDYSAQLSWQSQSKDNLKVLMDNFSASQYDRFEAYRRHALPKTAVRKVIQQTLGQQVSQPVAQIVAGFGKVFVGEMVEKARSVQEQRGEHGPLTPDHLREAYRLYQEETGRVGAARPLRSKRLFVK